MGAPQGCIQFDAIALPDLTGVAYTPSTFLEYMVITEGIAITLTDDERNLRDRFAKEYLEDYNEVQAAIRLGYAEAYARDYGKRFLSEPYTANKIKELERAPDGEALTAEQIARKRRIAQLERQANYYGPGSSHGARVSALTQICKLEGIEAPVKTETSVNLTAGPDVSHLSLAELEQLKNLAYGKPATTAAAQ